MIKKINGQWHQEIKRPDGSSSWIQIGGSEDKKIAQNKRDKIRSFNEQNAYQKNKDYSSGHQSLFGSNFGGDLYYGGPNSNWGHALRDRLGNRQNNSWKHGLYENYTSSSNQDNRAKMYARNNAIEDMYRRGYSWNQISSHLAGETNALENGPDWADYNSRRDSGIADDYFFDVPDAIKNGYTPSAGQNPQDKTLLNWNNSNIGQAGSAWGPRNQNRLFSPENEMMRKMIGDNLEKKLFG